VAALVVVVVVVPLLSLPVASVGVPGLLVVNTPPAPTATPCGCEAGMRRPGGTTMAVGPLPTTLPAPPPPPAPMSLPAALPVLPTERRELRRGWWLADVCDWWASDTIWWPCTAMPMAAAARSTSVLVPRGPCMWWVCGGLGGVA